MNNVGKWILFGYVAPYGCTIGWGWLTLCVVGFFAHKIAWGPYGVLTAQWRPWFAKRYRYSTTLGRAIIYHPDVADGTPNKIDTRVEQHEWVHIRQCEDLMVRSCLLGLALWAITGNVYLMVGVWFSGGPLQIINSFTSLLRNWRSRPVEYTGWSGWWRHWVIDVMYRGSEHERSAYAGTNIIESKHVGKSWLQVFEEKD